MRFISFVVILVGVHQKFGLHNKSPLVVIPRIENRGCLTQQERDSAHQFIRESFLTDPVLQLVRECGGGLNWTRVAYLNMSDPMQSCPSAWRNRSANGVGVCGLPAGLRNSCSSNIYSNHGQTYTKICGRVIGYQFGHTDAFRSSKTIDEPYVDGVSITHGNPRSHIWTFAADRGEINNAFHCPCEGGMSPPSFVGNSYYCESGYNGTYPPPSVLFTSDPLWDGAECESEGSCCSTAPWFTVDLVNPTADDIEVRICSNYYEYEEDTPIHLLEFYIQ